MMTGERLVGLDLSVAVFREWALSDWTSPTTRGMLAEFLVRCVLNLEHEASPEWEYVDIHTPSGTIEVKSSAYLQTPTGSEPKFPKFEIAPKRNAWSNKYNRWIEENNPRRRATCYVFCAEVCKDWESFNPLDLRQWSFVVLPTKLIDRDFGDQKTVALSVLTRKYTVVKFADLADSIEKAMNFE